ncbi:hypothetical protein [Turicibacter sanguinis]|uniref:hypothetical protein n=1 Tax=Turicibacter sanguinis TaxID=154288 RepID=UPI0029426221|nr:hypothetical protein [Turicibacter sanguinis]
MIKKIVAFFCICCILLIGLFIKNSLIDDSKKFYSSGAIIKEGVIPGYTAEQIKEMMQREADKSTFSFELNARPVFIDGKSEGNLRIANPPYSAYAIQVDIKLDDNQKTVFKTIKLQPNQYVEKAKLFEQLECGEYDATATINAYDLETDELVGTSTAKLIITINN